MSSEKSGFRRRRPVKRHYSVFEPCKDQLDAAEMSAASESRHGTGNVLFFRGFEKVLECIVGRFLENKKVAGVFDHVDKVGELIPLVSPVVKEFSQLQGGLVVVKKGVSVCGFFVHFVVGNASACSSHVFNNHGHAEMLFHERSKHTDLHVTGSSRCKGVYYPDRLSVWKSCEGWSDKEKHNKERTNKNP